MIIRSVRYLLDRLPPPGVNLFLHSCVSSKTGRIEMNGTIVNKEATFKQH